MVVKLSEYELQQMVLHTSKIEPSFQKHGLIISCIYPSPRRLDSLILLMSFSLNEPDCTRSLWVSIPRGLCLPTLSPFKSSLVTFMCRGCDKKSIVPSTLLAYNNTLNPAEFYKLDTFNPPPSHVRYLWVWAGLGSNILLTCVSLSCCPYGSEVFRSCRKQSYGRNCALLCFFSLAPSCPHSISVALSSLLPHHISAVQ